MAADFDGADEEVEFLDLGTGSPDWTGAQDDVDWLDEPDGEERVASGRDPSRLPPRANRSRTLASVLSLAVVLSAAIGVGTTAYHRHETDVRIANTLTLAASSTAPSIPGLTELAFASQWHAQLSEQVVIPVVNKGPHAITLVDGKLSEAGLHGVPTLEPVGKATIPPGGTGELGGTVTADCTTTPDGTPIIDSNTQAGTTTDTVVLDSAGNGDSTPGTTVGEAQARASVDPAKLRASLGALQVRARSVSGHVGEQTIFPEQVLGNTAERICTQQGQNVAQLGTVKTSVDPRSHTFTVSLTGKSMADTALEYDSRAAFAAPPGAVGLELAGDFAPTSEDALVPPGGTFTASFQMTVVSCPTSATFHQDQIVLSVVFASDQLYVASETATTSARPLIYEACGLPADWRG